MKRTARRHYGNTIPHPMLGTGEDTYHRSVPWDRYYIWNILIVLGGDCPQDVDHHKGGNPWKASLDDKLYVRFLDVVWGILSDPRPLRRHRRPRTLTTDDAPSAFRTPHANNVWGTHFRVKEFVLVTPDKSHGRFEPRQKGKNRLCRRK